MLEGNRQWKPLSEYTPGDFAIVGGVLAVALAIVVFIVLALSGVIPGVPAPDDPEPIPTATASPTPEPTPGPVLLGGEDRRACGLFWESYEWAIERQEGTHKVFYFTNDAEVTDTFVTFRNGCQITEIALFLRNDIHNDFDVEQFRTGEVDLFHWGIIEGGRVND